MSMFKSLLDEHQAKQSRLKEEVEVSRRSALNAVSGLTESLVDTVNSGVVDVFENQKKIEEEARELQGKSAKFARVTSEWVRILNELREIGDFENWIKSIEFDLNNLTGVMEYVATEGAAAEGGVGGGGGEEQQQRPAR